MKRVISAILVLAMALSISNVFALPLSAEEIYTASSEAVTTAPEELPELPEATTTLPEAEDIMQGATDPVPEVTEPTPEVTEPTPEVTEPTPEVTEPTTEATEPDPAEDSTSEDLPLAAGDIVDSGFCGDTSNGGDGTNLTWTLDSAGTLTISGSGKMADFKYLWQSSPNVIPWNQYIKNDEIKIAVIGEGVTSIGSNAFADCDSLFSVIIPNSVTSIGICAFQYCESLTSIIIPDSVTSIGDGAFAQSGLTLVTIPANVTSIEQDAFYGCASLTSIEADSYNPLYCSVDGVLFSKDKTEIVCYPAGKGDTYYNIPTSVTSIGGHAFSGCTSLASIIIPNSVTSIGGYAFSGCTSLVSIIIPDSVTSIGDSAFAQSGLTSVTIPDSVISIGGRAFSYCASITSIDVDSYSSSYCSIDGVLFSKDKTEIVCYPAGKRDTYYNIPTSVTSIGEYAFSGCTSLASIIIPDSVTSIGYYAFAESGLTSVIIPDSVTSIGYYAFAKSGLTSVIIPASVTSIGFSTFWLCKNLTDIYCEAESKPNGWDDLWQDTQNWDGTQAKVHWGYKDSSADITAEGFCGGEGDGTNLSWTLTGDGTLTISGQGKMADFTLQWGQNPNIVPWNQYLNSIKNVIIDEGVTSVGDRAFEDGKNIASVTIPDSVTAIGFSAFSNCHSLSNIFIPNSVTLIETTAFSGCSLLKTIELAPNNDYYHMDSNCLIETKTCTLIKGFDDSVIPDDGSVKVIANSAFSYCEKITTIKVPSSIIRIDNAFTGCPNLSTITVDPENSYYHVDGNCLIETKTCTLIKGFNDSVIPDDGSVTYIRPNAFWGCSGITSIDIPNSVTTIDSLAFQSCTGLKRVLIPASVVKIGWGAFSGCSSLTDIYCEAVTKPEGWDIGWQANAKATIHWNCNNENIIASGYCGGEGYGANLKWVLDGEGTLTISGQGKMADWSENINLRPWNDISGSISSVILKDGVTSVGAAAFYNCKNLTSITIPSTVTNIETYALAACAGLASVTIPNGVTSIGKYAFIKCNALTSVTIPGSVAIISEQAFGSCSGLTSVTILSGVTAIERCAFLRCSSLTSITIPGSVTSIGDFAFQECASLTSATIEDGVTSIGKYAFSVCPALTSVTIPDSVISIGEHTFWKSSKLTSITIPSGVTSIGDLSFWGCTALSAIEVDSANQEYCSIDGVLFSKDMSEIICYPAGKIDSSYAIPNGVKSIRGSAFAGSSKLTSITIPDSVASIGDYAFNSCGLTSVVIPESVEIMGKGAFVWCRQLNNIRCEAKTKPDGWNEDWQGSQNSQTGAKAEVTWSSTSSEFVPGDVSGDNKLNNQDAIHLLKHVMNSAQYTINQNADMNGDGKVNNQDAIYLLKHILNPASYPLKN